MNTRNPVSRTTILFSVLAIAGIGMAVSGRSLTDTFDQIILIGIGSALFGASLTFFLVRMIGLTDK